jgi:hypothetical protein
MTTTKTRRLSVPLTREEVEAKASALACLVAEVDDLKDRKRALGAELTAKEKVLMRERSEVAECIRTKSEKREVDVARKMNLPLRTWEIRRADTDQIVDSEPMTDLEVKEHKQGKLFAISGKKTGTDEATALHPAPLTHSLPLKPKKTKKGKPEDDGAVQ